MPEMSRSVQKGPKWAEVSRSVSTASHCLAESLTYLAPGHTHILIRSADTKSGLPTYSIFASVEDAARREALIYRLSALSAHDALFDSKAMIQKSAYRQRQGNYLVLSYFEK